MKTCDMCSYRNPEEIQNCLNCGNALNKQKEEKKTDKTALVLLSVILFIIFIFLVVIILSNPYIFKEKLENQEEVVTIENNIVKNNNQITIEEFISFVDGIWVSDINNGTGSFEFIQFSNGTMVSGVYPGEFDRPSKIVDINRNDDIYEATFKYEAEEYFGEYYPEKETKIKYHITDVGEKTLTIRDNSESAYGINSKWVYYNGNLQSISKQLIEEHRVNKLPSLENFKNLMNNGINDYYKEAGINAVDKGYLIKNYEIIDMKGKDATYEYLILGTYGPNNSINIMGTVNNGKVEYIYTFVPIVDMNLDGEDLSTIATMTMISVKTFNNKYSSYFDIYYLMTNLIQKGTQSVDGTKRTLVIDEIEYTLTASDTLVGFTINARK